MCVCLYIYIIYVCSLLSFVINVTTTFWLQLFGFHTASDTEIENIKIGFYKLPDHIVWVNK